MNNIPDDQLNRQLRREQFGRQRMQQELGQGNYKAEVEKKKQEKDYSRSLGGKLLEEILLEQIVERLELLTNPALATGSGIQEFLATYQKTQGLPLFDIKTKEPLLDEDGAAITIDLFDAGKAALIGLRILLNSCRLPIATMDERKRNKKNGARPSLSTLEEEVGARFETEMIINYASAHYPDGDYHTGLVTRILQDAYTDRAGAGQKDFNTRRAFQNIAKRGMLAEVFGWRPWSRTEKQIIGNRILKAVTECKWELQKGSGEYSAIFELTETDDYVKDSVKTMPFLSLTEVGLYLADRADKQGELKEHVDLPMIITPLPHTQEEAGGYLQVCHPLKRTTVKGTWKADTSLSQEHLDFQNKQQNVAMRICRPIYHLMQEVLKQAYHNRSVGSFKGPVYLEEIITINYPDYLSDKKRTMARGEKFFDEKEQTVWDEYTILRKAQFRKFFELDKEVGESMTRQTLEAAKLCLDDEKLFVVVEDDFRGRFYCASGPLNYQGQDHQKGLIEFAESTLVDDRTEYWMKLGMSGFMGLDKLSYEERIRRFDDLRQNVIEAVRDPIGTDWWKDKHNVEKPWQWMQVAMEWVRLYVDNSDDRYTRCRVPIDATCSGQQISAGWLRCRKTAEQVNLTESEAPNDIYSNVLGVANRALEACQYEVTVTRTSTYKDSTTGTAKKVKGVILKRKLKALNDPDPKRWGAVRKGSKGILMVAQYGAGPGRRKAEFADKTKLFWMAKEEDRTFDFTESAALYKFFKKGLDECCPAVDKLLAWVQSIVTAVSYVPAQPFLKIPLADGSVIAQKYPQTQEDRINLVHYGHKKRRRPVLLVSTDRPDIDKHKSSTTANLVHGGDSSVLVFGLGSERINFPFTTCHDSVSASPGKDMDVLQDELRKGLHEVFLRNPLEEFVTLNGLSIKDYPPPTVGDYDIEELFKALYAFC